MGVPYNKLVAPAVLYLNPGITREEYVALLDDTHSSCFREYKSEEPWDYFDPKWDDWRLHEGLEGLAGILGLPQSEDFKKFQTGYRDENGFFVRSPYMLPRDDADHKYSVVVQEGNVIEASRRESALSWGKLEVGGIWEEVMMGCERGIVTKIFEEKSFGSGDDDEDSGPKYEYKMEIKPFYATGREEKFRTKEEMYAKWPQFHPDFVYVWEKDKGNFTGREGVEKFLWQKEGGRYSLDPKTFDVIPASGYARVFLGYTDLILTAEAVKRKAWKVLSYGGMLYLDWFLRDFPEVQASYDHAVIDAHISMFAKKEGMTITEMLRFRRQGMQHINEK